MVSGAEPQNLERNRMSINGILAADWLWLSHFFAYLCTVPLVSRDATHFIENAVG